MGSSLSKEEKQKVKVNIHPFAPPIKISGENLTVSFANGTLTAPYSGDIIIKSVDPNQLVVLQLSPLTKLPKHDISVEVSRPIPQTIPHDYVFLFSDRAKSKAYGRTQSDYLYYKRERDLSYMVIIRKNGKPRKIRLGSLLNPNSILTEALRVFPKNDFFRKDIKLSEMPSGLRQGQRIKGALDVLTHEGFLLSTQVKWGKRMLDRYAWTGKTIEEMAR